jgi:hypothetical protein
MRSLTLSAILFNVLVQCFGQTFNNRISFGQNTIDEGFSCYEINDKYHFVGGYIGSIPETRGGICSISLNGEVLQTSVLFVDSSKHFICGASGCDLNNDIIVAGGTLRYPTSFLRIGIVLGFNENGDTLFGYRYADPDNEDILFYKSLIVSDGYLGCGVADNEDDLDSGILVKFDLEGNVLWRQDYLPQNNLGVFLYSADQTPDGGFLLGGSRISGSNNDHLVIKTDSLGNEEWRKHFGNQFQNGNAKVAITADGKYVFCGYQAVNSTENSQPQVTKLELDGDTIWTKFYGNSGIDKSARSIKLLQDGGFVFAGRDRYQGVFYGQIRKIDADGNEIWYRRYTHTDGVDCWFNDVTPTSDGGYILTGLLGGDQDLGIEQDMWAMKVDSYGCLVPGCELIQVDEQHPTAMSIYPNPCDDFINVYVEAMHVDNCDVSLYDIYGKLIRSSPVRQSGNTLLFDSISLPDGIYVLNLSVDGKVMSSEKVVVKHG